MSLKTMTSRAVEFIDEVPNIPATFGDLKQGDYFTSTEWEGRVWMKSETIRDKHDNEYNAVEIQSGYGDSKGGLYYMTEKYRVVFLEIVEPMKVRKVL